MEKTLDNFSNELSHLMRARYPLIGVQTFEELRALSLIESVSKARQAGLYIWSRTEGVVQSGNQVSDTRDPMGVLQWYSKITDKSVLVLKDFHPYLKEPTLLRKLRDLARDLKCSPKNIVLLSPVGEVPQELSKEIHILDFPLPSPEQIRAILKKATASLGLSLSDDELEGLADAASGLTQDEIENVLARCMVARGQLDKTLIQEEKRQIVKRAGILEFIRPQSQVCDVGGLDELKTWLGLRRRGLSQQARELNLPAPKGILLVGVPGCGKSLTAMTVGKQWELPLLRLDMGRIFSGLVGSSESNLRRAIATCEAVSPCILWVDEIEKGLSGSQSGGSDGGTSSRVFGTFLTWLQEKQSMVFVVATANDISQLPPEFLRKGRFDEIFFVDLPSEQERSEIFNIHLNKNNWTASDLDLKQLVNESDEFSGSEIAHALVEARYLAFGNNEEFSQKHILSTLRESIPLSRTMADRIESLRGWAKNRARPASRAGQRELSKLYGDRARSLELGPHPSSAEVG